MNEKLNHLGIDVGKRKCRAALKDDKGRILDEFFFGNDANGILDLLLKLRSKETRDTQAVLESTGNMWMRIHDTLEENGINTILANPYKTKIIAEAKIKSDKLDARILSDLLRTNLIYESYVPKKEDRDKRSLVRHRITLSRTKTKQYKEAIEAYERVILIDPDFANAYYDCARSLLKLDSFDIRTCIKYLKKAFRLDPELKEKAKSDFDFQSIKNKFELDL